MFEFVEKVVYINLEHRTDRKAQIEDVLKDIPSEKVIRFNAIKESHGGIGCTKSHIAVLKMAQKEGWKNVMIVEDDATWNKFEEGYPILQKLLENPFDVITLGTTFAEYDKDTYKLSSGQTTTAYIVDGSYYETLLSNYEEGLAGFQGTGQYHQYALDQFWKRLQVRDNWYCVIPSILVQRAGYSDIEKRVVDYIKYFK